MGKYRQRKEMRFSEMHHEMLARQHNPYVENTKKLKSCPSHNFTIPVQGGSMKCDRCGGILSASNVSYYNLGRLHEYHDNLESNNDGIKLDSFSDMFQHGNGNIEGDDKGHTI